jgi:ParB family chromosome partitioning protein
MTRANSMGSIHLDVGLLEPSKFRPGKVIPTPAPAIIELAKNQGIDKLPQINVRPLEGKQRYEILTGLLTWRVAQIIQIYSVPVTVLDDLSNENAIELLKNDNPEGIDVITKARHMSTLVENYGCTIVEVGRIYNLSRTEASHRIRLLSLADKVIDMLAQGEIKVGHGRALVGLKESDQLALAQRISREKLNVRKVEDAARKLKKDIVFTKPKAPEKDINHIRLEDDLTSIVGSKVKIDYLHSGGGDVKIHFDDLDILEGILEKLGYQLD